MQTWKSLFFYKTGIYRFSWTIDDISLRNRRHIGYDDNVLDKLSIGTKRDNKIC